MDRVVYRKSQERKDASCVYPKTFSQQIDVYLLSGIYNSLSAWIFYRNIDSGIVGFCCTHIYDDYKPTWNIYISYYRCCTGTRLGQTDLLFYSKVVYLQHKILIFNRKSKSNSVKIIIYPHKVVDILYILFLFT